MNGSIIKRKSSCPAHNSKCHNCQIAGHFTTSKDMKTSKSQKGIKKIEQSDKESQLNIDEMHNINRFRITISNRANQYNGNFKI